jgi:hypothetical protein
MIPFFNRLFSILAYFKHKINTNPDSFKELVFLKNDKK